MKRNWLLVIGILSLAAVIAYRACAIPFTHDEASSWLNYRHINVWACISNAACWGTANNHWLNTLLFQLSASIFGEAPWALRLPNVLAGFAYLICAALLCTRYTKSPCLQFAGFLWLSAHVYLLDFFSLARGYGLMACGIIWGVYTLLRYTERFELRWLLISQLALSFAILGNFTALLPWVAMFIAWFLWLVLKKKFPLVVLHGLAWLIQAGILFALLYFPIKTLSTSGEFAWGAKNVWEMARDLMVNLLYGAQYFGDQTPQYLLFVLMVFIVVLVVTDMSKKKSEIKQPLTFMALLLLLNLIVIMVQQKLTGSSAPIGRKSIYLIPFVFGLFAMGLTVIRNMKMALLVGSLLSFIMVFHFYRSLSMRSCREWYYDAYYPELISTVFPHGAASDSVRLGTTWIFNPAMSYYQKTLPLPVSGLAYQKPLVIDSIMQYYYVETQDTVGATAKGFVLEKRIGPFLLLRNNIHSKQ